MGAELIQVDPSQGHQQVVLPRDLALGSVVSLVQAALAEAALIKTAFTKAPCGALELARRTVGEGAVACLHVFT